MQAEISPHWDIPVSLGIKHSLPTITFHYFWNLVLLWLRENTPHSCTPTPWPLSPPVRTTSKCSNTSYRTSLAPPAVTDSSSLERSSQTLVPLQRHPHCLAQLLLPSPQGLLPATWGRTMFKDKKLSCLYSIYKVPYDNLLPNYSHNISCKLFQYSVSNTQSHPWGYIRLNCCWQYYFPFRISNALVLSHFLTCTHHPWIPLSTPPLYCHPFCPRHPVAPLPIPSIQLLPLLLKASFQAPENTTHLEQEVYWALTPPSSSPWLHLLSHLPPLLVTDERPHLYPVWVCCPVLPILIIQSSGKSLFAGTRTPSRFLRTQHIYNTFRTGGLLCKK